MSKLLSRLLRVITLAVVLLSSTIPLAIQAARAEIIVGGAAHYDIQANLDYDTGLLTATESVTFVNTVAPTLDSIVFNVTPAHFDAFKLKSVRVDGQAVTSSLKGNVMEVPMTSSLQSGASTVIQIDFSLSIPSPGNMRFGRANGIIALGNWYPVLSVYRQSSSDANIPVGWSRHAYVDTGDAFLTSVADYDVKLEMNTPATVAHTGNLVQRDGTTWVFHASNVRDFAMAISKRFETKSEVVGNTTVTAFYLPEHSSAGQQYLDSAAESLAWFNKTIAVYPYSTIAVVETSTGDPSWVGQEYPNIVFISDLVSSAGGGVGSYLDYLVVHENLHQWFYGLVGNDQLYEPWVDEATVTYVTYMYFRANYPAAYEGFWQSVVNNLAITKQTYGDRPVNGSIYDYNDENYYYGIVYRKGAMFLDELRKLMGDDAFFGFLRQYVAGHTYGIATAREYLSAAQSNTSSDITPLVTRYFTYTDFKEPTPTATATSDLAVSPAGQPGTPSPSSSSLSSPVVTPSVATSSTTAMTSAVAEVTAVSSTPPNDSSPIVATETSPLTVDSIKESLIRFWPALGENFNLVWSFAAVPVVIILLIGVVVRRRRR